MLGYLPDLMSWRDAKNVMTSYVLIGRQDHTFICAQAEDDVMSKLFSIDVVKPIEKLCRILARLMKSGDILRYAKLRLPGWNHIETDMGNHRCISLCPVES